MAVIEDCFCAPGSDFFEFNLKYMFFVGLWPNKSWPKYKRLLYKFYDLFLHLLLIYFLIITGIGTYQHKDDVIALLTDLDKILVSYNFFFKILLYIIKSEDIRSLIIEIINSGDAVTEETKRLMKIHVVLVTSLATSIVVIFSAMAQLKGEMTVDAWMPFDPMKSRLNLILSAQIIAITFVVPCVYRALSLQGIVCSLIMYLYDQLIDLKDKINSLQFVAEDERALRDMLKKIIVKHIRLIRYANLMSKMFSDFFFLQNMVVTVELCLNALMATLIGLDEKKLMASFLAFLGVALINSYIYCYLGNELIIQSEGIAEAAYESSWTSWPLDIQKQLLLVITMAQRPLTLTAGGVATMSMKTYSQTLYNGYSIFAVLHDIVD